MLLQYPNQHIAYKGWQMLIPYEDKYYDWDDGGGDDDDDDDCKCGATSGLGRTSFIYDIDNMVIDNSLLYRYKKSNSIYVTIIFIYIYIYA